MELGLSRLLTNSADRQLVEKYQNVLLRFFFFWFGTTNMILGKFTQLES